MLHGWLSSTRLAVAFATVLVARRVGAQPLPEAHRCAHAQQVRADSAADSIYASVGLCELVSALSAQGRTVPVALRGYHADIESEIAFVLRTAAAQQGAASAVTASDAGRERLLQVEQIGSALSWTRSGELDQHVTGYRARSVTGSISALTVLRHPWVVPVLYGNRLHLLLGRNGPQPAPSQDTSRADRPSSDALAIHPFADDREQVYHFAGGDTIAVLKLGPRAVTVVRIRVEPRTAPRDRTLLFRGLIDVDAERHQIIRMRGQFVLQGRQRSALRRAMSVAWETVVFAELENAEFEGRFWLPTRQRIEGQARSSLSREFRPLMRVVSSFTHYRIDDSAANARDTTTAATGSHEARITFAPRDSINAYDGWRSMLGAATSTTARATDFDDVAPDSWRPRGATLLEWRAERVNDVFRYNRVEGVYTGAAATLRFRDAAPGVSIGAHAGWAWSEETARGALWTQLERGAWAWSVRAERALVNTNDFRPPLDYEQSLMALLVTADDYDYVDRRSISIGVSRRLPIRGAPLLRLETGPAHDNGEPTRIKFGLIHLDSAFRNNRPATTGSYLRTAIGIDIHSDVTGDFLAPGVGGGVWYERGDGALSWQRMEARLTARRTMHAVTIAGRVDGIAVRTRQALPQQLIEFGENEGLPGYAYKEFGGDRAVLARGALEYQLPWLRAPIRLARGTGRLSRIVLPGLSPALAIGGQAGWSVARDASTRAAIALIGTRRDTVSGLTVPATRPTDGVRSTVNVTLRLFGGTLGLGLARPIDSRGSSRGWSFLFGVGQPF
jgi:hypothetical protein